ncbi:hypothetical protein VaNZ11_000345 [Volvox africanus]|uniref:Uncharacterized protein n=1 Tax=Volvox africanus TaxID=51714 RepID=A0ABQ5RND4_9CHLO|nr:hypothetical protein VaNZ11_000345 [Volvox africanus]
MRGMWGHLRACFSTARDGSSHAAHGRMRALGGGSAIGEGAQQNTPLSGVEQQLCFGASTFGSDPNSPRAIAPVLAKDLSSDEQQQMLGKGFSSSLLAKAPSVKASHRTGVTIRFDTSKDGECDNSVMASTVPSGCASSGAIWKSTVEVRGARVQLLLPNDSAKISNAGGGGGTNEVSTVTATAVATPAGSRKVIGSLFVSGKPDGEPRALAQLAGLLLTQHVHYRSELEAIMTTHGSAFPMSLLADLLQRNNVTLPQKHLRIIETLYRVEERQVTDGPRREGGEEAADNVAGSDERRDGCAKIDGLALLKDLDRSAFRHVALGGGPGGEMRQVGEGANAQRGVTSVANSKKNHMPSGQLGDKTRILQLVASQLANDESLRIRSGSGEDLTPAHLQEAVEQIDLTSIAIPVGTRAPYVASGEEPDSFKVPVWSLRAMQLRKQQRDQELLGSDPHLRHLGQAGREALRLQLTRRSLFQQEEIIANAVVTAARAAVTPSARLTENSIQLGALSRLESLQRTGSRNSSSSPQRRSATVLPAASVVTNQSDGGAAGGRGREMQDGGVERRDQDTDQIQICGSRCGSTGSSVLNSAAIVEPRDASSSGDGSARGATSPFTGVSLLIGCGGPSLVARACAEPSNSGDAGGGGGTSDPSLASSGAAIVSSPKVLYLAGSGMTELQAKVIAPMPASVSQKLPTPLPSLLVPLSSRPPPIRGSDDGALPLHPRSHQGGPTGAVAGEEPLQVGMLMQGGSAMEAAQRVVGRVSPHSPLGRSAWETTGGERDCTAECSSRSGSGGRVRKRVSGDGTMVNAGSMGGPRAGSAVTKNGNGRSGYAEGGPQPISSPCARVGTPLLLRPGKDDGEPHNPIDEGLLRRPRDREAAAMLHRGSANARSNSQCQVSNFNTCSTSGSRVVRAEFGSWVNANIDNAAELPGQCSTSGI